MVKHLTYDAGTPLLFRK